MREALKILLISFVLIIVVGFIGLKVLWGSRIYLKILY